MNLGRWLIDIVSVFSQVRRQTKMQIEQKKIIRNFFFVADCLTVLSVVLAVVSCYVIKSTELVWGVLLFAIAISLLVNYKAFVLIKNNLDSVPVKTYVWNVSGYRMAVLIIPIILCCLFLFSGSVVC